CRLRHATPRTRTHLPQSPHSPTPHREREHMDALIPPLLNGSAQGALLLLAALGLSLTFGQMGVINMAHGEFLMIGAFTAYLVQQVIGRIDLSLLVALTLARV